MSALRHFDRPLVWYRLIFRVSRCSTETLARTVAPQCANKKATVWVSWCARAMERIMDSHTLCCVHLWSVHPPRVFGHVALPRVAHYTQYISIDHLVALWWSRNFLPPKHAKQQWSWYESVQNNVSFGSNRFSEWICCSSHLYGDFSNTHTDTETHFAWIYYSYIHLYCCVLMISMNS